MIATHPLPDKTTMSPIILASTSPYRQALLGKLGMPFTVMAPNTDETVLLGETAEQLVKRLAIAKASDVASRLDQGWVIGSDQVCTIIIFGDGAGAVVLGASEEPGILSTHMHADGRYGELLKLPQGKRGPAAADFPAYMYMKGNDVFKVAVTRLSEIVTETLAANGLDKSELDWLVPHQANYRIISATAKKLGMSMDQVILTLEKHGNTSAASVPLALDEGVRSGRIQRGQLILLEAFGGGFTWGSALIRF